MYFFDKICNVDFSDTTHLVCFRSGTAKYREAKKKNIKVSFHNYLLYFDICFEDCASVLVMGDVSKLGTSKRG